MSAPHATAHGIIAAQEDNVRALLDLLVAALRLAEKDGTEDGEALNRIIGLAHDKAEAVMGMWDQAFAATRGEKAPAGPARDHASRQRLESAVMECEGDVLLLQLAVNEATRHGLKIRGGFTRCDLNADQLLALDHAMGRMQGNVRELSAAFYGREDDGA